MEISKNSKLLSFIKWADKDYYQEILWGEGTDICTLTQFFLGRMLIVLLLAVVFMSTVSVVAAMILFPLSALGLILLPSSILPQLGTFATFGYILILGFGASYYTVVKADRDNPGIITQAYRSWKEKTCLLIPLKEKEDELP